MKRAALTGVLASLCCVALPSSFVSAHTVSFAQDDITSLGMTNVVAQAMPTETPASSFMPLATPSPRVGPAVAVDNVLAQASEYDGKPVQATGVALNVRTDDTAHGPVLQFDLCGHHCIHVLDAENPSITDNATATITGVFHKHFEHGRFSQDDIMLIMPNAPSDDTFDWQRQLNRRFPGVPQPEPEDTSQPS